jgi:hypothetical protein
MSETYEVRRYRTASITNAQADAIFAAAVALLATDSGADDVPCVIEWSRDDDVEEFTTGDGSIASQAELTEMFEQEGNIKVVNAVDFCGGVMNVSAVGCAERPGEDIVVERVNSTIEAVVWAHEYGHNKGLTHRNVAGALMHETAVAGNTRVNAAECAAFQARFEAKKGQVAHTCGRAPMARPADVRDFVRQVFIHGVRWDVAAEYDGTSVPPLLALLQVNREQSYWTNAVTVLCLIGDDRAVEPLIELLERGEGEITVEHFSAKRAVLAHIGSLVQKSGNEKALAFLLDSLDEKGGWRSRVKWKNPFHGGRADEDVHLTKMAAWGLALSGKPAAGEALGRLAKRDGKSKGLTAVVDEATAAHAVVAAQGTMGYYQTFHT